MASAIEQMHIHCILLHDISFLHHSVRSRSTTSCYSLDRYSYSSLDHFIYLQRHWHRYTSNILYFELKINYCLFNWSLKYTRLLFYIFNSRFPMEARGWQTTAGTPILQTLPHILAYVQLVCRFLLPNRITTKTFGNPY